MVIGEDADGHIDVADLETELDRRARRPLLIGSFCAASNVTGILTDTGAVAALLHARGALSFWDYAAAGPYVDIRVSPSAPGAGDHKDAVFLSPHKFPGGPRTPGVLVVRHELVRNAVPTSPGGGTVAFVDPVGHRYLDDPVAREEGGTPAIIESIRAGLVVALKQAVGTSLIAEREEQLRRHVLRRWAGVPQIEVLGNQRSRRLSIVSFRIRCGARYLHHNFVVAVLNDLFGIQARGGCSCAGPYGHRLLAIGAARSHALREEIGHGCDGIKPGWARVNLNYFISPTQADYIAAAVQLIAADGYRLLPAYRLDPRTGLWRHAGGAPRPPLRLTDVSYGPDGEMAYPRYLSAPARTRSPATCAGPGPCSPDSPASWRTGPPASARTSRRSAGSRCRRAASARCRPGRVRPSRLAPGRERIQRRAQPGGRVLRDLLEQRLPGNLRDFAGVERLDDGGLARCPHHDVARQQQADGPVSRQRPAGERRVAGPEDDVLLDFLAELLPQRRLHVDLGQHAETLSLERLPDLCVRLRERGRCAHGHRILHWPCLPRRRSPCRPDGPQGR